MRSFSILLTAFFMLYFLNTVSIASAQEERENPCLLDLALISASEILDTIRNGHDLELHDVIIPDVLDFRELAIADEETIIVESAIDIQNACFREDVVLFYDKDKLNSSNTHLQFSKTFSIISSRFEKNVYFSQATFGSNVNFNLTTFQNEESRTNNDYNTYFDGTIFAEGVDFSLATFNNGASFYSTSFANSEDTIGSVNFLGTQFLDDIAEEILFDNTKFHRRTFFDETNFASAVRFSFVEFTAEIRFRGTIFSGNVSFKDSKFTTPIASFQHSSFNQMLEFTGSSLGVIDFRGTQFSEHQLNLFDATYTELMIDNFNIEWVHIPTNHQTDPTSVVTLYAQLESDFRAKNRQALANNALFEKREWECSNHYNFALILNRDWMVVECHISRLSEHFVRLEWILFKIALIIFGLALAYKFLGVKREKNESSHSFELKIFSEKIQVISSGTSETTPAPVTTTNIQPNSYEVKPDLIQVVSDFTSSFLQSLILSFDIFVAIRFSSVKYEIENHFRAWRILARILIFLEWFFGLILMLALAVALVNTLPIVGMVFDKLN